MYFIKRLKTAIVCTSIFLIITFMLSGCMRKIPDYEALEIIDKILHIDIKTDSATIISTDYNTNIREDRLLIVVDIVDIDINDTVHRLRLIPTSLSEAAGQGMSNELTSIMVEYFDDDQLIYCRYEYDHLLNGDEHPASVYLIALSASGRLLLYSDI